MQATSLPGQPNVGVVVVEISAVPPLYSHEMQHEVVQGGRERPQRTEREREVRGSLQSGLGRPFWYTTSSVLGNDFRGFPARAAASQQHGSGSPGSGTPTKEPW